MDTPATQQPTAHNVWFTVSVGLMGLILGYSVASFGKPFVSTAAIGDVPPPPSSAPTAPTDPNDPGSYAENPTGTVPPVDLVEDHVTGPTDAKVTMIVYEDYECPFCKRHHDTVKALREKYKDTVNFAMRHFPLSFHQNAEAEAIASECIASLGGTDAFWKYTDTLLERTQSNGTGFPLDGLPGLAKEIGVNEAKFKECMDSKQFLGKVQEQMQAGMTIGINGTPGNVIINNVTKESKVISGAVPLNIFEKLIDDMLKS